MLPDGIHAGTSVRVGFWKLTDLSAILVTIIRSSLRGPHLHVSGDNAGALSARRAGSMMIYWSSRACRGPAARGRRITDDDLPWNACAGVENLHSRHRANRDLLRLIIFNPLSRDLRINKCFEGPILPVFGRDCY